MAVSSLFSLSHFPSSECSRNCCHCIVSATLLSQRTCPVFSGGFFEWQESRSMFLARKSLLSPPASYILHRPAVIHPGPHCHAIQKFTPPGAVSPIGLSKNINKIEACHASSSLWAPPLSPSLPCLPLLFDRFLGLHTFKCHAHSPSPIAHRPLLFALFRQQLS